MNGFTAPASKMTGIDKWSAVNRTISTHKIAILALQETHLDPALLHDIETCFGKRLLIINSQDPTNPRASAGVAFVINKTLITPKEISTAELIKGRALSLKIKWRENEETVLINVYAPNNRHEHPSFWKKIDAARRSNNVRRPDFLLGDLNVTEDPIDRAPAHADDLNAVEALRNLRHSLDLQDSWRHAFPHDRSFTYRANHNGHQIKSRLDRIYTSSTTAKHTFGWETCQTAVPTDHWMVLTKYAPTDAPFIGKGRWTWQIPSLEDKNLIEKVIERGKQLQLSLTQIQAGNPDRNTSNPQSLWKSFKDDIKDLAVKHNKSSRSKIAKRIDLITKDLKELTNHPELDGDESIRFNEAFLANELRHLEKTRARDHKDEMRTNLAHQGEVLGGAWSAINKERKPRDVLYRLKIPNSDPPVFERNTTRMAELARSYHKNLQSEDLTHPTESPEYTRLLRQTLNEIPASQKLHEPAMDEINWEISPEQVKKTIHFAKKGSATGTDGCPYELWKTLATQFEEAKRDEKEGFDIIGALTTVYTDISMHGVDEQAGFANGWMCPIYKKKDPTEICNYRPITLLNTDYKLLTKVLAIQLMDPIHTLVHPDQAGFIPRRSIFNHIRLAKAIINYTEVMEENGAIVALDQEKAYDKIRHDYLWATLESFGLPPHFTKMVKALYQNAHTQVAINGVLSCPFKVTRGVRQGDPLSCPLFDLAIEPLACKLRNDPEVHGFSIPGLKDKLVINLFADDTTLYLSDKDSFNTIEPKLKAWCDVSGAKFNIEKTEIIPLGTQTHRDAVITTRKISPRDHAQLDERIHIARDGEAVRSLGAWIGNHAIDPTPWEIVLDKSRKKINLWKRSSPAIYSKRLIIQAIIGGHTQFLATAQGMPAHIETALEGMIRDFIWDHDTAPRMALEYLYKPIDEGGLNILNISARNEAIEIVWLKSYLDLSPSRPAWAIVTDLLINAAAPPGTSVIARINTFTQSWNPPMRGPRADLVGENNIRMIKVANKYGTNLAAIRLSPEIRSKLPAWYHPFAEHYPMTNAAARCLLKRHKISTVAELVKQARKVQAHHQNRDHTPNRNCACRDCAQERAEGCQNPHACATEALTRIHELAPKYNPLQIGEQHDNLSLTNRRKNNNTTARKNNKEITFDPSITCKDSVAECFRIFMNPARLSPIPARRPFARGLNLDPRKISVYMDGACWNNGKANAKCGSGVWLGLNNPRNAAIRVPGPKQSNQVGELAAVIAAASSVPTFYPLTIITDSRYVIDGLTKHLGQWEDNGWIGTDNAEFFKRAAYLLKKRTAATTFQWVKGHRGNLGNEESDKLAKEGANKDVPDIMSLDIPKDYDLQGAKLATLTQAVAYKGIQLQATTPPRPTTNRNLETIRQSIQAYQGSLETDKTIWNSLRKRTIRTRVQQFLFKALHNTPMVGAVWFHIQGFESRGECRPCATTESMEHILVGCTQGATETIWRLAKESWDHERYKWPTISLGIVLGCGNLSAEPQAGRPPEQRQITTNQRGATRLLQILVSEAAHLIWVLRCKRVIQEKTHSPYETEARWLKAINRRLTEDKIVVTKIKREKQYSKLIQDTWNHLLTRDSDPPHNWIQNREVLVGRRAQRALPN